MMMIFGAAAALSAVLFLVFIREAPPTPPCPPGQETRALMLDGLKSMLKLREYAAEITYPAPEGTSNGLLNLAGQVSVVFIYGMQVIKGTDGTFTLSLSILIGLLVVCGLLNPVLSVSQLAGRQAES